MDIRNHETLQRDEVAASHEESTSARFHEDSYPSRPAPKDPLFPGPFPMPKPGPRPPKPIDMDDLFIPKSELDTIQKFLDSLKKTDEMEKQPKKDRIAEDAETKDEQKQEKQHQKLEKK